MTPADPAHFLAVEGLYGDLTNACAGCHQDCEQIIRIAISRPELRERKTVACGSRESGVSTLTVVHIEADKSSGESGKNVVTQKTDLWHPPPRLGVRQAVALAIVHVTTRDGSDHCSEIVGVHLPIGSHHGGDVGPSVERDRVPRRNRGSDPAVPEMTHNHDARIVRLTCNGKCCVGARIVDDDNLVDEPRNCLDRSCDEAILVIRGNDHRHACIVQHANGLADRRTPDKMFERIYGVSSNSASITSSFLPVLGPVPLPAPALPFVAPGVPVVGLAAA